VSRPLRPRVNLGKVFLDTGTTIRRAPLTLLGLAALDFVPRAAFVFLPVWRATPGAGALARHAPAMGYELGYTLLAYFIHAAVAWTTLATLAGQTPSPASALRRSASAMPLLAAVSIVALAPYAARVILLSQTPPPAPTAFAAILIADAATALVAAALFGVLTPTVVNEGVGFPRAFVRTFLLMNRGRWLYLLGYVAVDLFGSGRRALYLLALRAAPHAPLLRKALHLGDIAVIVLVALVYAVFTAAYYRELCRLRDGVAPGEVAQVFD
jgi:hypothetical protein